MNAAQEGDNPTLTKITLFHLKVILHTSQDQESLRKNFSFLIARILKRQMRFFKKFSSGLERHLQHEYYRKMCEE
jgi:hypothetical protein